MMKLLAWSGVVGPVIRLSLILALGYLTPEYSQPRDAISELGAPGAPYAGLMNFVGISLVGLLLVLFSLALLRSHRGRLAAVGSMFLALSGLSFIVLGLFPCDLPECALAAAPSTTMRVHLLAGFAGMTTQTLAVVLFGIRALARREVGTHAASSIILGAVATIGMMLLLLHTGSAYEAPHPGLVQKVVQAATDLWVLGSGIALLTTHLKAGRPT